MSLPELECPKCGTILKHTDTLEVKIATSYDKCLRKCEKCGVAYSNAQKNPTIIYKDYWNNLPKRFLETELEYVLENALNITNRENKKKKFGFSTSEDALTWVFFKYFVNQRKIDDLLSLFEIESNSKECKIYLWGVNITSLKYETILYKKFIEISEIVFKEELNSRTEPDVMIELNNQLIFIEVKNRSENPINTRRDDFDKYKIDGTNIEKIKDTGYYELYRNWAFLSKLSDGKKFTLINLGPQKIFDNRKKKQLDDFKKLLDNKTGKFITLSWEKILTKLTQSGYRDWFIEDLKKRLGL